MEYQLEHAGVKGMKWGVRKAVKSRANSAKRERSWTKQYRERDKMSDDQLRSVVNRLRLENDFAQLAGRASKGQRKMAKDMIKTASSIAMSDTGKKAMASVVGAGLRKGMTGGVA